MTTFIIICVVLLLLWFMLYLLLTKGLSKGTLFAQDICLHLYDNDDSDEFLKKCNNYDQVFSVGQDVLWEEGRKLTKHIEELKAGKFNRNNTEIIKSLVKIGKVVTVLTEKANEENGVVVSGGSSPLVH